MTWIHAVLRGLLLAGFVIKSQGKVKVAFRLIDYSNPSHHELDGGCCDPVLFSCGSACDNRFNLCFDEYGGNNNMAQCDYGNYVTNRLYENNDDFNFPSSLNDNLVNPIILTINQWSTGFRSKIEVWDYDPSNSDDKIDYYGYNYNYVPARTSALATEDIVSLNGAGTSQTRVGVKVYCDVHYYGTSSGCNTYCLARDNNQGHYDCNNITGARMCHAGWTGSYCQNEINECQSNPCESNAVCTDLLDDYSCNCPLGTEGKNCVDINECSSSPCEHGGTCLDKLNYYECQCIGNYSGANCELDIDFCQSYPCDNGGTCLGENDSGLLECACAAGYTGVFCAQDIDDCIRVDCLNNGTCHDGVDQFTCNCTDGYGGTFCELDVRDECSSDPCQNNASCVDKVGGYICVCHAGFQSDHCDEDINECDPNPCSYGDCTDRVGRYTCECLPGYSGENCTINIDDCLGNMCDNNSTCQDQVNNYTCICMAGYTGVYCDSEIDECSSSPCQNDGICQDSVNSFTCECASTGYRGQYCEIDIDECQDSSTCPSDTICVNVNGSYDCNTIPMEPTSFPGLCRTRLCYNDGICSLVNGSYQCVCSDDFTGKLCETPRELCVNNTCDYGTCQVFTAVNGSVYYTCICQEGYSGTNCRNMEHPMITCPVIPTLPTEEGESYATVSWDEPSISNGTITNNSGSVQLIFLGPGSNGGNFEIGAHVLTYLVIDEAGNSNNCSFFIDVIDDEDPVIHCPESIHVTTRPDLPSALVSWDDPTGSDNSGDIHIVQDGSIIKDSEFMIGVSTVTYIASDMSGNSKNCSFAINVTDNQDPIIRNCPSSITIVSRPGLNMTEVSWTPPKATDNSGPVEPIFIGPGTHGGNYSIGTVIVTYKVEDMSGNMDTCSFSITVRDYSDVVVICPMNVVIPTDPGRASADVAWPEATNPPGWSNVTITLEGSMQNGGEYPIGETSITYFAVDPHGLNSSCSFFVVVIDEEKPNITCPALVKAYTETNVSYARVSWPEPTAMDNSGNVKVSLIGPGSKGDVFYIGDTNLSYRAVDDAANPSSCIVTIRVIDDEPPVLTCPENISTTTQPGSSRSDAVTWYEPSGSDNSGRVTVSQITTEQNGGNFKIGVTNISYQAFDDSENNIKCVFYILVEDNWPPDITCPDPISAVAEQVNGVATVTWTEPDAQDNSGTVTVTLIGPGANGGSFSIGMTNLSYLAVDETGNVKSCDFSISVEDPPICLSNPCLNGGTCKAFSGLFSCLCLDGFQGQTCQQAPVTCETGSNACNSTEECVNSVCRCRPNFIQINGVCIRNNRYRLTLTVISLLGESLEFMDSFSDPLSDEFQSIADAFKVVVLSITSFINDITVVKLESGSVIFTFDSFVDVSVGESVVLLDFQEALERSGASDLIFSPNTVPEISDFDECADATTNDCSLNANCRNTVGSYECTCYSNYNDESIGQSGSGRICVFHRGILIALICVAVGFTLCIVCCGALCCLWSRYQQNISASHAGQKPDKLYKPHRPHSKSGNRFIDVQRPSKRSESSKRKPSLRFTADSIGEGGMPCEIFQHPRSSVRNQSLHHPIADRLKISYEDDRSERSAFSHSEVPAYARKHHSNAPSRYSLESDHFFRPCVVTGSEPTIFHDSQTPDDLYRPHRPHSKSGTGFIDV